MPSVFLPLLLLVALAQPAKPAATPATERARRHYEAGLSLFEAGDREQALVEFRLAQEVAPKNENVFMIAQCEYHLGRLKEARAHYEEFLARQSSGEFADLARARLEAIARRPGVVAINTVPPDVGIRIEGAGGVLTSNGQNQFEIPRGQHVIHVAKANHVPQSLEIDIEAGETKQFFFKLDPVPARLEIRTHPRNATLYVRGSRAQNPYMQLVEPGAYEIYAEATDYRPRREVITLGAGEQRALDFALPYVQRSGRPELIGFWTAIGAVAGSSAVLARLEDLKSPASGTLFAAAGLVGGVGGGLFSTAFVPDYIPDNQALFRIGAGWIGAAEGAALGLALAPGLSIGKLSAGWVGGAVGLAGGTVAGTRLDGHAPNYGRVALVQSAAIIGSLAGFLTVPAFDLADDLTPPALLGGLNAGLAVGLAAAYLPDQRVYGPTWQRVVLVDLAGAAGAFAGALATTLDSCLGGRECRFASDRPTARFALAGGTLGLVAGWLLTRNYDRRAELAAARRPTLLPTPTLLPFAGRDGRLSLAPALAAGGRF